MTFRLFIDTDNAAFGDDDEGTADEIARILHEIAYRLERDESVPTHYQTIRDHNGNDVGRYALKSEA